MKSTLAKLSVCIGLAFLAVETVLIVPQAAHAKDVVKQCSILKKRAAKKANTLKHIMKSKNRKVSAAMIKELKTVRRQFSRACESEVCGDMNDALCKLAGGDVCIAQVRPQTFQSIAEMTKAGGVFIHAGACSGELTPIN